MSHLSLFESKFTRLKEDRDNVMRAKEALELQEPGLYFFPLNFRKCDCLNDFIHETFAEFVQTS